MKTFIYAWLIAMLFVSATVHAQDTANKADNEWMIPLKGNRLDAQVFDKASFLKDEKHYADVEYVYLKLVADAQQDGKLTFRLPNTERKVKA